MDASLFYLKNYENIGLETPNFRGKTSDINAIGPKIWAIFTKTFKSYNNFKYKLSVLQGGFLYFEQMSTCCFRSLFRAIGLKF